MKNLLFYSTFLLVCNVYCQNCSDGFYPFKAGNSWELTNYNADNKPQGKSNSTINTVTKTTSGFKANISAKGEDAKGKETFNSTYDIECAGNVMKMDMKNFMGPEFMKENKDTKFEFSGDNLETPSNINIGDTLKRGTMTMIIKRNDVVMMTTKVEIYDRKVLAKEQITVPAGTYSCYKISYKTRTKSGFPGMPTTIIESTEWISRGVGVVKIENYNKGKLSGSSVLTKFSN
jgi:hypothetical protein